MASRSVAVPTGGIGTGCDGLTARDCLRLWYGGPSGSNSGAVPVFQVLALHLAHRRGTFRSPLTSHRWPHKSQPQMIARIRSPANSRSIASIMASPGGKSTTNTPGTISAVAISRASGWHVFSLGRHRGFSANAELEGYGRTESLSRFCNGSRAGLSGIRAGWQPLTPCPRLHVGPFGWCSPTCFRLVR